MRRSFLILAVFSIPTLAQSAPQAAQPPIVVQVQMPPTPAKGLRDSIRDFGPLIAAFVAVGVWLNQRRIQNQQLGLQYFDRRFQVYAAVRSLIDFALKSHKHVLDDETYTKFNTQVRPAKFLFRSDVTDYLREISQHITAQLDEKSNIVHQVGEEDEEGFGLLMTWANRAELIFGRYLQFREQNWLEGFKRFKESIDRWMDDEGKIMASRYK